MTAQDIDGASHDRLDEGVAGGKHFLLFLSMVKIFIGSKSEPSRGNKDMGEGYNTFVPKRLVF